MDRKYYSVAGHTFCLVMPERDPLWAMLTPYAPFECAAARVAVLFTLIVDEKAAVPSADGDFAGSFGVDGSRMDVYRTGIGYAYYLAAPGETGVSRIFMPHGCREVTIVPAGKKLSRFFALNNALMLMYAFASAPHDTLLMHASVINRGGKGFLFLGKSGTGKSTHSRLWLEHIAGSGLLNDDNPVVRIIDGQPWVFGSPWSGKTSCYKNESVPVDGIVKLQQAPENRVERLSPLKAYAALLPACSCMKWEENIMGGVHDTVEKLAVGAGCYRLCCLPDKEAVILCCSTVSDT